MIQSVNVKLSPIKRNMSLICFLNKRLGKCHVVVNIFILKGKYRTAWWWTQATAEKDHNYIWQHQRILRVVILFGWALAGWLNRLECHLEYQGVSGLIPSQGTYWDCGFDPWSGCIQGETYWCFTLTSMFLSLPSSLCKINKIFKINKEHILRWGLKQK